MLTGLQLVVLGMDLITFGKFDILKTLTKKIHKKRIQKLVSFRDEWYPEHDGCKGTKGYWNEISRERIKVRLMVLLALVVSCLIIYISPICMV